MAEKNRSPDERSRLIEQRLQAAAQSADAHRISHDPTRTVAPLSAAQKRIWLLNAFDPGTPVWNRPLAVRLVGALECEVLRATLTEIVRRHQILRTNYRLTEEGPQQVVDAARAVPLEFEDLSSLPEPQREGRAQQIAIKESGKVFDLSSGPMVRAKLLRLHAHHHVLLVLMHHITFDGWSEGLFHDELRRIYGGLRAAGESPLPEPVIQYHDFAAWEEQGRSHDELDRSQAYWRGLFASLPPKLNLPKLEQASQTALYSGGSEVLIIETALRDRLKQFSKQEHASLFMTLLMSFQLLLARYCDQDDISVGVPVAGRIRSETEKLIGCFMNVLVLRATVSEDLTVRELMAQVREASLGAFAHQALPFEQLVKELRPERRPGRWPLFQAMFHLRNLPGPSAVTSCDLELGPFEFDRNDIGGIDLSLEIQDREQGLRCCLTYRRDVFEASFIRQMLGHFHNLLVSVLSHPDQLVWTLPMLSEAEHHQQVVEWNDTGAEYPSQLCVHHLFEAQVEKTPHAVAVTSTTEELTYRELNRRANRLAYRLQDLGVGPGVLVGLCVERSAEMVIAILAVLKAGGGYVPLNPGHPPARLRDLIKSAELQFLLVTNSVPDELANCVPHLLEVGPAAQVPNTREERNLASNVRPSDLIYVLFTSGSTGQPKGVMIRHASVVNFLFFKQSAMPLNSEDRVLARASYTFDDSVWELFEPLVVGARIILAEPGRESDCAYLVSLIAKYAITILCLVPSQLELFLQEPKVEMKCRSLRRVSTGGETLSAPLLKRFRSIFDLFLFNGYGPTEATIACTYYKCEDEAGCPPIGRPISNTQIYVLGRLDQIVPLGVRGELCVAGACLSPGYLNDLQLTDTKFVPNPFSKLSGSRLYRTGDIVRYRFDSNLEFLGRADNQVKIRGHRIELGEIEAALLKHPDVRMAVVLAVELPHGTRELVAYLVAQRLGIGTLRGFLQQRLPDSMLPSRWVFLDSMPMTSSGKIDRKSLPQSSGQRSDAVGEFRAQGTPAELALATIWAKLLGLEQVGIEDNFFDLGGHSLLAVSLLVAVRREFGIALPVSSLYQTPTVKLMAEKIQREELPSMSSPLVPIQATGSAAPIFVFHAANGRVLMYGGLARRLGREQPIYGLQSPGLDGEEAPLDNIAEKARLYLAEIQKTRPEGPYHLVGFCHGAIIAWEMAHQIEAKGGKVGVLAMVSHDAQFQPLQGWQGSILGHLRTLRHLKPGLWTPYIARRLRYRFRRLTCGAGELLGLYYQWRNHPLPAKLRHLHVAELNHQAGMAYQFRPGPWRVHYFEGRDNLTKQGAGFWRTLAKGGVVTHPISGRNEKVWREPYVQVLAEELKKALSDESLQRTLEST